MTYLEDCFFNLDPHTFTVHPFPCLTDKSKFIGDSQGLTSLLGELGIGPGVFLFSSEDTDQVRRSRGKARGGEGRKKLRLEGCGYFRGGDEDSLGHFFFVRDGGRLNYQADISTTRLVVIDM